MFLQYCGLLWKEYVVITYRRRTDVQLRSRAIILVTGLGLDCRSRVLPDGIFYFLVHVHMTNPPQLPPHTHTTIIVVAAARWYNTGARFYDFQRLCSQKAIKPSGVCRTAVNSKSLRRKRRRQRRRRRRCRLLRATAVSGLMEHTFSLYANRIYL